MKLGERNISFLIEPIIWLPRSLRDEHKIELANCKNEQQQKR